MTPRTHPFITFDFRTATLPADIWMMLGEAMSKCQHLAGAPLKPSAASAMSSVYLARGVAATTAIEGNTLSVDEVKSIVDNGSAGVSASRSYLELEVQNVLAAIRDIDAALEDGLRPAITVDRLCMLNLQLLRGIPDKPEVVPGVIREHDVAAGSYKAPHWPEVPELLDQLVSWLAQLRGAITQESRDEEKFVTAVLAAVLAHLYIAWVHPFGNGNGRLARLIEVQILSESGVVPLVATNLLSDHYNKTRNAYYLALDAAQHDVTAFIRYALRGFVDELREQIQVVRRENLVIHWESYVYERFHGLPSTKARDRQRDAALAMRAGEVYTPEQVTDLTTNLARQYAIQGERTPARDLNALVAMNLVQKVGNRKYRALREIIEAFIPPTAS
ncbi:Fic family protein [Rathayibacter sp. Leaf296]|uniref:Fic family protein n=1 Tax=Rathayibacter sp. Leaf296 TaxID=1736327 RepID=UPI00070310BA|nr:Fic family protein [Rathayibacter sp. Leaf296]KQQ10097.1 hypothetical protein ASF46_03090 [Rathayibacter sp. Leaf296]